MIIINNIYNVFKSLKLQQISHLVVVVVVTYFFYSSIFISSFDLDLEHFIYYIFYYCYS